MSETKANDPGSPVVAIIFLPIILAVADKMLNDGYYSNKIVATYHEANAYLASFLQAAPAATSAAGAGGGISVAQALSLTVVAMVVIAVGVAITRRGKADKLEATAPKLVAKGKAKPSKLVSVINRHSGRIV